MKLVIIESPYAGRIERNIEYAKRAMMDCLWRGEAPIASHLLYTQVLNDLLQEQRELGIAAGLEWGKKAELTVVYTDYGTSPGMVEGIKSAVEHNRPIEYRTIGRNSLDDAWDEPSEKIGRNEDER